jgi:NAD(P)-dependent dehydrogenase (short-subunit alcohol dehydrogenase family)
MEMKEFLKIKLKENTRVIVTAGAAGIGRTIAEAFLFNGAKVFVCDISKSAVNDFNNADHNGTAVIADVSDSGQVEDFFDTALESMGGLDVLVNNAGIAGPTSLIEDIDPDEWDETIKVNLKGAFLCTKNAITPMKKAGSGSIINIASNAAMLGYPRRTPYSASKWAIIGMTKTVAMEAGPFKIRVNAICPGSVQGPRIENVIEADAVSRGISPDEIRDAYLKQVSLHTFVDAEDVANTALFLASEYGATISGQTLGVDGHSETLTHPIVIYKDKEEN